MSSSPAETFADAISAALTHTLENLARDVWRAYADGTIDDRAAQRLAASLDACRKAARSGAWPVLKYSTPVLKSINIDEGEFQPIQQVAWCPWCEDVHRHGAAGGGHRVAHCLMDRKSPLLCTGYALDLVGSAESERVIVPDALMAGERRLHQVMSRAAGVLRSTVLRHLLNCARVGGGMVHKRFAKGAVWIFGGSSSWRIEPKGKAPIDGEGLLRLAAALYGVSPGVAAVRFFEAAALETLDAPAVFALQRLVDEWMARGAPGREVRR